MTTKIRISTHKDDQTIGTVTIADDLTRQQVAAIADEACGLADLVEMGDSDMPEGYEWTGDEEYEIL
jgi:hypothetical protein